MSIQFGQRRVEFDHEWEWHSPALIGTPHWRSVDGSSVSIFPPRPYVSSWYVKVGEELYEIEGKNAEQLAFSLGANYRQATPVFQKQSLHRKAQPDL